MATQEFYIRSETDTEARGPFTSEQLLSLAENGQVTAETLYYEALTEQWVAIGTNQTLLTFLFPEKKKLNIKSKEGVSSLNVTDEEQSEITVEDMLAAAEGRTEDTKDKQDPGIVQARCARFGMLTAVLLLVLSAGSLMLPHIESIMSLDQEAIWKHPLALLGVVDLAMALLLCLQMITIYPLIRFRAALGLGFTGIVFWTQGELMPLIAVTAGCIGLYLCTIVIDYILLIFAMILGLVGMGAFAYFSLLT